MTEDIEVCGVLVHVKPGFTDLVRDQLERWPQVEVHLITDNDRLVVTVENSSPPEEPKMTEVISCFHDIKGVLSAALIYQHAE